MPKRIKRSASRHPDTIKNRHLAHGDTVKKERSLRYIVPREKTTQHTLTSIKKAVTWHNE